MKSALFTLFLLFTCAGFSQTSRTPRPPAPSSTLPPAPEQPAQAAAPTPAPATRKPPVTCKAPTNIPTKADMKMIMDSVGSLDSKYVEACYDKAETDVWFDVFPMKYVGWEAYKNGVNEIVGAFQSIDFTLNDDATVTREGNMAFGTATWSVVGKMKNGNRISMVGRWTVIWQKKGKQWLIVHEHLSSPSAPPSTGKRTDRPARPH